MGYGTKLKSGAAYHRIFNSIKKKVLQKYPQAVIEHVGGTSLKSPAGKGDVDIYIEYKSKKDFTTLQKILTALFGKPAKITKDRVRYNLFIDGVEVELQLTDTSSFGRAISLRNYLNSSSREAKHYASGIAKMRKEFLDKMFKFKKSFAGKAAR